jgi:hypothetical protein
MESTKQPSFNFNIAVRSCSTDKEIGSKKGKKGNTATVKKMVIADPGFGLIMTFSSDDAVHKIEVEYTMIDIYNRAAATENSADREKGIGKWYKPKHGKLFKWTINGDDGALSMGNDTPYHLLIPFVSPGENVSNGDSDLIDGNTTIIVYQLDVEYYDKDGNSIDSLSTGSETVDTATHPPEGYLTSTECNYPPNVKFKMIWHPEFDEISPNHLFGRDYIPVGSKDADTEAILEEYGQDLDFDSYHNLKGVIFHTDGLGVSGKLKYEIPADGLTISIRDKNKNNLSTQIEVYHTGDFDALEKFFYLPYPKVAGITPGNFELIIGNETKVNAGDKAIFEGDFVLKLTAEAYRPDKKSHSS